jgi:hypothetical protein
MSGSIGSTLSSIADFVGRDLAVETNFHRVNQSFEDLDMFMAGGVIFF